MRNTNQMKQTPEAPRTVPRSALFFDLLKTDHKEILRQCHKLARIDTGLIPPPQKLFEPLLKLLRLHSGAEEAAFYNRLKLRAKESGDQHLQDLLIKTIEEHDEAELVLREAIALATTDQDWNSKILALQSALTEHFKVEEGKIFERAKILLSSEDFDVARSDFLKQKQTAINDSIWLAPSPPSESARQMSLFASSGIYYL